MASSWEPKASQMPVDKGLWATLPDIVPDLKTGANAFIENGHSQRVYLWINDVTANFALAGSMAQSRGRRSFYPHNLVQPILTVAGQMPNTMQYNRLALFVRDGMLRQIYGGAKAGDDGGQFYLRIFGGGKNTARPIQRGHHEPISVDGYIEKIAAGATRFINAPPFQFDFVLTRANDWLGLQDVFDPKHKLAQIYDLLQEQDEKDFLKEPVVTVPQPDYPNLPGTQPDTGTGTGTGTIQNPGQQGGVD